MSRDHPLRPIRAMVDEILKQLSLQFNKMYAKVGRPSIPPEQLLRVQLSQMLYSVRSERLLMEEMGYNILFRWFVGLVGLNMDDEVWDATVFTKHRDRLLEADFVRECRNMGVTPHVAQNPKRRGGSAVDGRTTQHRGYCIRQKKRKRIEGCSGW